MHQCCLLKTDGKCIFSAISNSFLHQVNYAGDEGYASKPLCTESYNSNMDFVDMSDMMANNYGISRKTC
jgi:hypothetical protein